MLRFTLTAALLIIRLVAGTCSMYLLAARKRGTSTVSVVNRRSLEISSYFHIPRLTTSTFPSQRILDSNIIWVVKRTVMGTFVLATKNEVAVVTHTDLEYKVTDRI